MNTLLAVQSVTWPPQRHDCLGGRLPVLLDVLMGGTSMAKMPDIILVIGLRQDAAAALKRVRASKQPVVITQRGRAAAVMLSVEANERAEHERQILRLLARGEREITAAISSCSRTRPPCSGIECSRAACCSPTVSRGGARRSRNGSCVSTSTRHTSAECWMRGLPGGCTNVWPGAGCPMRASRQPHGRHRGRRPDLAGHHHRPLTYLAASFARARPPRERLEEVVLVVGRT